MDWTSFVAAAIAPIVLWLLWRIQGIAIAHGLRRGMYKLLRYQRRTYNVVSWFGVLLHELSHAFFLLVGGHGIREFKVKTDSGHVTPTQIRRGPLGLLSFITAALAPMFVAPAIIFLTAWAMLDRLLIQPQTTGVGLDAAWPALQFTATEVPLRLLQVLVGLDVATAAGAAVFLLAVFAMPSARPSYVAGKRGQKDEGDIAVVRAKVRQNPLPVVAFFAALYGSYFAIVPWRETWYWGFWQTVWSISLTATILALLGGLGWAGIAWAGRAKWWVAWIPGAAAIATQVLGRMETDLDLWLINIATIVAFAVLALGLWQLAPRRY